MVSKRKKKNKILVADDNEEIRNLLAEAVSFPGCEVSKASDGEETLKLILKNKPDILILDINMPKKNGFEVLRTIKSRKTTKDIYVIVYTVRSRPKDVKLGYELGANVYFEKPRDVIPEVKKALELIISGYN